MTKQLEINKEWVLSTAHVSPKTLELLGKDELPVIAFEDRYGFRILTRYGIEECLEGAEWLTLPNELKTLLLMAEDYECKWLVLDQYGDIVPEQEHWVDGKHHPGWDHVHGKPINSQVNCVCTGRGSTRL